MATEKLYSGNGSDKTFEITFPYLKHIDIKVFLKELKSGATQPYAATDYHYVVRSDPTDYTISGNIVTFTNAPADGTGNNNLLVNNVKLTRDTIISSPEHEYNAGSTITAARLNANQKQALYAIQEAGEITATPGGISTGDKGPLTVSSDSSWSMNNNSIINAHLQDNSVDTAEIKTNAVTHSELKDDASTDSNRAVTTNHIRDNAITMAKLGSGALPTDITVDHGNIVADAIRNAEIKDGEITLAKLAATVANLINTAAPVGTIIYFSGLYPPIGYIKADGGTIGSTTTTFAEINYYKQVNADYTGTSYIGTINTALLYKLVGDKLPDLRGQFVRGFRDTNTNIDNSGTTAHSSSGGLWSSSYGTNTVLRTQTEEWKKHQHIFHGDDSSRTHWGSTGDGANDSFIRVSDNNIDFTSAGNGNGGKYLTQSNSQGNSGGTETRPMNIALLACIKY